MRLKSFLIFGLYLGGGGDSLDIQQMDLHEKLQRWWINSEQHLRYATPQHLDQFVDRQTCTTRRLLNRTTSLGRLSNTSSVRHKTSLKDGGSPEQVLFFQT